MFTMAVTHPVIHGDFYCFVLLYVRCFPLALNFPQLQVWLLKIISYRFCASIVWCITILHRKSGAVPPVDIYISCKWLFLGSPLSLRKISHSLIPAPSTFIFFFYYVENFQCIFFQGLFCNHFKMFLWFSAKMSSYWGENVSFPNILASSPPLLTTPETTSV